MTARPLLLAIEDERAIVELLSTLAEPLGLELRAAATGAEALAQLDAIHPALITLDLVLPDVDGFDLLAAIRARPELTEVPVVVITALAEPGATRRAYQRGASDVIRKPFNVGLVEAKLAAYLTLSRRRDELRERERFLDEVMAELPSGLCVLDAEGRVVRLNAIGARALGLADPAAALGHPLAALAPGAEALAQVAAAGDQRRLELSTAAGRRELGYSATRLSGGGVVVVFRELAATEAGRRDAEDRARHEALSVAAHSFAHEVRNPLAAIAAAAQVVTRPKADDALKQRLARAIESEALRIAGLVGDYVERQTPAPPDLAVGTDLRAVLEEVLEVNLLGNPARPRVRLFLPEPLPPLRADPARLKQVVLNLIFNAIAATDEGGNITVSAAAQDGGVRLSVSDSGTGMSETVRARIFDESYTTRPGGQGLGLSIARRIVEEHGGQIRVESAPGRGSAFVVWLRA